MLSEASSCHYFFRLKTTDDRKMIGLPDPLLKKLLYPDMIVNHNDANEHNDDTTMILHSPACYLQNNMRDDACKYIQPALPALRHTTIPITDHNPFTLWADDKQEQERETSG